MGGGQDCVSSPTQEMWHTRRVVVLVVVVVGVFYIPQRGDNVRNTSRRADGCAISCCKLALILSGGIDHCICQWCLRLHGNITESCHQRMYQGAGIWKILHARMYQGASVWKALRAKLGII